LHAQIRSNYGAHPGRNGALTDEEMKLARIAWKYFERNTVKETGMVNAVDMFPSMTMWDVAAYMGAMTAALELGIINQGEFDGRMERMFASFQKMEMFRNELPNKCYHTQTLQKVDYGNNPGEIGYSALDLARFMMWCKIIKERYPQHSDRIDDYLLRWNFKHFVDSTGVMYGAYLDQGKTTYVQEGRLGYEEYAAQCLQAWGFDVRRAAKPEPYDTRLIYGTEIPYDNRDPRVLSAHNYVVCESYVLFGIELNWDKGYDKDSPDNTHTEPVMADFANRVYKVQEERWKRTKILTARTEHQLDQDPYFVYDTIFTDGYPWNTITEPGKHVPQFAAVALKAALGLWALWQTPYTDTLFNYIKNFYEEDKGFYEGVYEPNKFETSKKPIKTFTMNNNGIMLETLLYKVKGKLLRFSGRESKWDKMVRERTVPPESFILQRQLPRDNARN
jgi:hypothetical protein